MLDSRNKQVKDAVDALIDVLKEVRLDFDDSRSIIIPRHQEERHVGLTLESLEYLTYMAEQNADTSLKNLNTRMENACRHLTSINDEIKVQSTVTKSIEDFFQRAHEAVISSDQNLQAEIQNLNSNIYTLTNMIHCNSVVAQSITCTNEGIKSEINSMKSDLSVIKSLLKAEYKQKEVEFQISCADLHSFTYYKGNTLQGQNSGDLVRDILKCFASEMEYAIRYDYTIYELSDCEEGRNAFRVKLQGQLQSIMGKVIRIVKMNDAGDKYQFVL